MGRFPVVAARKEKGRSLVAAAPDSRRFEKIRYAFWPTLVMVIDPVGKTFSFF
jgi:hypothetical protein